MKGFLKFMLVMIVLTMVFLIWVFQRDADGVPILSYHQVNDIDHNEFTLSPEEFDAQMKYLVDNGYTFMQPDELLDAWDNQTPLPAKPVVVTFGGGRLDFYKTAFPILQKYNVKATLFVVTDFISLYPSYITWAQAREMQESGLVDIESNTLNHGNLADMLSNQDIRNQLINSKQAVEWHMKKPANYLSYPGGMYTREVEQITHDAGYRAAFTIDYGVAHQGHYVLPLIPIDGGKSHTLLRFKARLHCAPIIAPLNRLKNSMYHDGNGAIAQYIWIP